MAAVAELRTVTAAQRRLRITAEGVSESAPMLHLFFLEDNALNMPLVVASAQIDLSDADSVWLDIRFAEESDLAVGDVYAMKIGDVAIEKRIAELCYSSEFTFYQNPASLRPNYSEIGFGFLSIDAFPLRDYLAEQLRAEDSDPAKMLDAVLEDSFETLIASMVADHYDAMVDAVVDDDYEGIIDELARESYDEIVVTLVAENRAALVEHYVDENYDRLINGLVDSEYDAILNEYVSRNYDAILSSYIADNRDALMAAYVDANYEVSLLQYVEANRDALLRQCVQLNYAHLLGDAVTLDDALAFVGASVTDSEISELVAAACVTACTGAAHLSVRRILQENPAQSLRPKASKTVNSVDGKNGRLWRRLSFNTQWNPRDVNRSRVRSAMGVIGAISSMALLITAFSL